MNAVNMPIEVKKGEIRPTLFSEREMESIIESAYAPGTIENRKRRLERFQDWLVANGYEDLHTFSRLSVGECDHIITQYMSDLFEGVHREPPKPLAPNYIALIFHNIRWFMRNKNGGVPIEFPLSEHKLKGLKRAGIGRGSGQRKGLTWEQVDNLCTLLEADDNLISLRNSLIMRVMSDALLRVSEVPPLTVSDFEGTSVIIRSSKTDQEGKGKNLYICDKTRDIYKQYLSEAGITEGIVFFSYLGGRHKPMPKLDKEGRVQRLTSHQVRWIIKQVAKRLNLHDRVSGHSLRIGSAMSLASKGATLVDMQHSGRWKSPEMPAHYARSQLSARGAVARLKDGK